VRGGKPQNPPAGTTLAFLADGKVRFNESADGKPDEGSHKTDPTKSPAGRGQGRNARGIYKIGGDTPTLCFSLRGERPTEFAASAGSEVMLVTCKRVKKE